LVAVRFADLCSPLGMHLGQRTLRVYVVTAGSQAEAAGVAVGWHCRGVHGVPVATLDDFKAAVVAFKMAHQESDASRGAVGSVGAAREGGVDGRDGAGVVGGGGGGGGFGSGGTDALLDFDISIDDGNDNADYTEASSRVTQLRCSKVFTATIPAFLNGNNSLRV
jgi:hypothetical protein